MNPAIKFTTLFGLLAIEMAVGLSKNGQGSLTPSLSLAAVFMAPHRFFVYRRFYGRRIENES